MKQGEEERNLSLTMGFVRCRKIKVWFHSMHPAVQLCPHFRLTWLRITKRRAAILLLPAVVVNDLVLNTNLHLITFLEADLAAC